MGRADGPGSESEGNSHGGGSSGGGSSGGGSSGGGSGGGVTGGDGPGIGDGLGNTGNRGGGIASDPNEGGGGDDTHHAHDGRGHGDGPDRVAQERASQQTSQDGGRGRQDGPGSRTEGNNPSGTRGDDIAGGVLGTLSNFADYVSQNAKGAVKTAAKLVAKGAGWIGNLFTARDIASDLEQGDTRGVVEKATEFISDLFSLPVAVAAAKATIAATGGSPMGWIAAAGAFVVAGLYSKGMGHGAGEIYDLSNDIVQEISPAIQSAEQWLRSGAGHPGGPINGGLLNPLAKPIALDLDGDGKLTLVSPLSSAALVEVRGDGFIHRTGWVGPGDGMIVYDRNGDGRVTFANELSFTGYVAGARTDLEGLRHFDSNGDGRLDSRDREWSKFRIWKDANSNGSVDAGEMVTPASLGLASLNLTAGGAERTVNGNIVYGTTAFTRTDGSSMAAWDVGLGTTGHGVKIFQNAHYFKIQTKAPDGTLSSHLISRSGSGLDIDVAAIPGIAGFQGTSQADTIRNGSSRDLLLHGGDGNDTVTGGTGNDILVGGNGDDRLVGGDGRDILIGGRGRDVLTGGTASLTVFDHGNIFNVADSHRTERQQDVNAILRQADVVTDFNISGNRLKMANGVTEIWVRQVSAPDGYDGTLLTGFNSSTDTVMHYVFLRGQQATRWADHAAGDPTAFPQLAYENLVGWHARDILTRGHFVNGSKLLLRNSVIGRDDLAERITGSSGEDLIDGGGGDDTLIGGAGHDRLYGGDGDDKLYGGAGIDWLYGGDGDDRLYGGDKTDILEGGKNNDYLSGDGGADLLDGGHGDDTVYGGDGDDKLYGGDGNDKLYGGANDDLLSGWDGNDTLSGNEGHDTIYGDDGDDKLYGGDGNDKLYGGANDDYLSGWDGNDTLSGNEGHDTIYGGDGDDRLYGGDGNDKLYGGANDDYLSGWDGNDMLSGNEGHDTIYGGDGDDRLYGGDGNDKLYGGANDDYLSGWDGNDRLYGGGGDDRIFGGANNDELYGGPGRDVLSGWRGSDWFGVSDTANDLAHADRITDFNFGGEQDRIYIAGLQSGGGVWYRRTDVDSDGTLDTVLYNNRTGDGGIYAILEDFTGILTSDHFNSAPTITEVV